MSLGNVQSQNAARRHIYDVLIRASGPLTCKEVAGMAGKTTEAARWLLNGMVADGVVAVSGRKHTDGYRFRLTGKRLPALADQTPQAVLRAPSAPKLIAQHVALATALGECLTPPQPSGVATYHFLR